MRYLWLVLLIGMAGVAGAGEGLNQFGIPDNTISLLSGGFVVPEDVSFTGTIHLDNCAAHGLEHSWKYYRIWNAGLVDCQSTGGVFATCKDYYSKQEITYPSGVTMDLPHGDYDGKVFRRVCKNCKLSEDMRVIHKEAWGKTE